MVFALRSGFIRPFGFSSFKAKKKDLKKSDTLLGMAIIPGSFFCKGLGTGQLILPFQILLSFPPKSPRSLFVFLSYSRALEKTEMNPFPFFFFFVFSYFSCFNRECSWAVER